MVRASRVRVLAVGVGLTGVLAVSGASSSFADTVASGPVDGAGTMRDLGTLPGGTFSAGNAVNASGEVAGTATTGGGAQHAFRWTPSGGLEDLGTLGGTNSSAQAINALGEVAGNRRHRER